MDSVLIDSPFILTNLPFNPLSIHSLNSTLTESVRQFLTNPSRDFAHFKTASSTLLAAQTNPPIELIWFHAAIRFHEALHSSNDLLKRIKLIRDLLNLFSAFSAASSGLKSVAAVAPAVSEIWRCLTESEQLPGTEKINAKKEIEGILEGLIGYVGICLNNGGSDSGSERLLPCFYDVARVWGDGFGDLFPLVSDGVRDGVREEGCEVGYLAGVVVVEVFLLVLSLKVRGGGSGTRGDIGKELRIWAVSSISAFASRAFYEILLKLLLNPPLPLNSLVNAADEILVRDILYDAVILIDYSFVNPDETPASIFIRRLIVSYQAIHAAREKGDQGKAISYTNAFSTSCVPNGLIRWASLQAGLKKLDRPNANTPHALLKWLVGLEEQGLKIFEDNGLKLQCKLLLGETKVDQGALNSAKKIADGDLFFFDNSGNVAEDETMQDEDTEQMDTAFKSAAHSMKLIDSNGRRKRKEWLTDADVKQMKSVKYKVHDSSAKQFLRASAADNMSSSSEVEDPSSDQEMDVAEQ